MAGILKAPRRSASGGLCLPGEDGWQYAAVPTAKGGGVFQLEGWAEADLGDLPAGTRLGLPARHLLVIPIWLQTTEKEVLRELAQAQLERRGLLPLSSLDGGEGSEGRTAWALLPIGEEEGRTLVTAYLVDAGLPSALLLPRVVDYDAAARFHVLPDEAFVFWREQGGISLAYGKGGDVAVLQFFPGVHNVDRIAAEVALLARSLAWEGVSAEQPAVHLWGGFTPPDVAVVEALFGVPPVLDADGFRRSLRVPPRPLSLVPAPVRDERRQAREQSRRGRIVKAVVVIYLLAVAAVGGIFGWMKWEERRLVAAVAENAPEVASLTHTADLWKALSPAIDPSYYPLESLLATVQILPQEMRLTKFESGSAGKLLLVGEGKDAASAFAFLHSVQRDKFLKKWTWTMPQPKVLPNNHAQFQLEGTRAAQ